MKKPWLTEQERPFNSSLVASGWDILADKTRSVYSFQFFPSCLASRADLEPLAGLANFQFFPSCLIGLGAAHGALSGLTFFQFFPSCLPRRKLTLTPNRENLSILP